MGTRTTVQSTFDLKIQYISTLGGSNPVSFAQAIGDGYAADGGLYVPTTLPYVDQRLLQKWQPLSYPELAYEIVSLFLQEEDLPAEMLKNIIQNSFSGFHHPNIIAHYALASNPQLIVQELFHGPSLSFKDIAMGFVVNLFNHFLQQKNQLATIIVATSGDTGPAAASASIAKSHLQTWVLFPTEFITPEQRRQMTTLEAPNVHAVAVSQCPDGSDDLDKVIAHLFSDATFRQKHRLSSVNSINWGRVLFQTVHYFYGYLQNVPHIGDTLDFAVPTGAFGNLCAGSIARMMGLPIDQLIVANNQNDCLAKVFGDGILRKNPVKKCPSSALDISVPLNFWRYLHFIFPERPEKVKTWMSEFQKNGAVVFDEIAFDRLRQGFGTHVVSDKETLATIRHEFQHSDYLLDPHAAVAVTAARAVNRTNQKKTICLATAHPAKFPRVIEKALNGYKPPGAHHPSIESQKEKPENHQKCDFGNMYEALPNLIREQISIPMRSK